MNLKKLLDMINAKKLAVQNLVAEDKLEEAKAAKEELVALQNKYDLLKDIVTAEETGEAVPTDKGVKPVDTAKDSTHEFANAVRSKFRNAAYDGNAEGTGEKGGYTVPKDIQTRIEKYKETKDRLETLVTVENVTAPTGARTYQKRAQHTGFLTVAEAAKVTKKDGPQFERVEYAVEKRSGYLPVTNELLEDSDANITNTMVEWLGDEDIATINNLVLAAAKSIGTAVDFKDLDGIKKAVNVTLGAAFAGSTVIVTNDDGLQYLDTLKDTNGRYILSPSVQDPMQMVVAIGARKIPLKVVANATLATNTTKIPFIMGDWAAAIKIFKLKGFQVTTSDVATVGDINAFEQDMTFFKGSERNDCKVVDTKALVQGYIDTAAAAAAASTTTGK